jgi:hypothetical protein
VSEGAAQHRAFGVGRAKTGMLAEDGFELLQYVVAESEKLLGSGMINLSL